MEDLGQFLTSDLFQITNWRSSQLVTSVKVRRNSDSLTIQSSRRYPFRLEMRRQVEELFHVVADLPPHARSQYFEQNKVDLNTRKEVESLLAFDSGSTGSLEADIGLI